MDSRSRQASIVLSSSAQLTGTLTLDAQGNPNAVFVFQIGSTLTTASSSSVNLINGGQLQCATYFGRSAAPRLSVQALRSQEIFSRSRASP